MTVYVDEIRDWTLLAKARGLRHSHWCHLTADTEEELHAFAKRLGLRRSWYQRKGPNDYRWHYDVTPPKRAHAVRLGAQEIDRPQLVQIMNQRRQAAGLTVFTDEAAAVGPRCGNNPTVRLSPGDQKAVDEFKTYLRQRAAEGDPR